MSAVAAAAITAGASIASSAGQIAATGKLNRKNREWQEEMWNKNNQYNSPSAQMARFREAGLNPHLIYGQGTNGNSSSPASAPDQKVPDYSGIAKGAGDAVQAYNATKLQQTQINQMEKNIELADTEKELKQAQTLSTLASTDKMGVETFQLQDLYEQKKIALQTDINKTNIDIEIGNKMIDKILAETNLTKEQQNSVKQSIIESKERVIQMTKTGQSIDRDNILKDLDINLRKNGINPNDPMIFRVLGQMIPSIIKGQNPFEKWIKKGKETVETFKIK